MHAHVAAEIWSEIRRYIGGADREEAADVLITVLINADEDIQDIRTAFSGDPDIKKALALFTEESDEDTDDDTDYDDYLDKD